MALAKKKDNSGSIIPNIMDDPEYKREIEKLKALQLELDKAEWNKIRGYLVSEDKIRDIQNKIIEADLWKEPTDKLKEELRTAMRNSRRGLESIKKEVEQQKEKVKKLYDKLAPPITKEARAIQERIYLDMVEHLESLLQLTRQQQDLLISNIRPRYDDPFFGRPISWIADIYFKNLTPEKLDYDIQNFKHEIREKGYKL